MTYDTTVIRELLTIAFNDEKLIIFCYDYFRPVHETFGDGWSKTQKVQALIEHCERNNQFSALLDYVKATNPTRYAEFEGRLKVAIQTSSAQPVGMPPPLQQRRRLGSRSPKRNPFRFNKRVRPEDFLGRKDIVTRIADDLYEVDGDSYGIVGGRRFGKSSLLVALEDELIKRLAGVEDDDFLVLPVMVSLKAMELTSPQDVFGLALHNLRLATGGVKKPLPLSKGPLLELGLPEYTELTISPVTLQELEGAIGEIVNVAYQKEVGDLRVALLIDEMDCALDFNWTDELFGMLRSLIYDGPVCDYARLVLAGSGRYLGVDEKGSPLFNAIIPCFLEAFADDAVQELVGRAEGIPAEVADEVARQGGGHPFILQHMLHYLVKGGFTSATKEKVEDEVRRFLYDRSSDVEGWWYAIGEDGRRIYCALPETGDWMTHADLIQAANDPNLQPDRGLKALYYHGLAIHDGTYQRFRLSGQLFRDWARVRCAASGSGVQGEDQGGQGDTTQVSQQAGAGSSQFGQVSNSTIIIQREASLQSVVEVDPDKAARLRPVVEVIKRRFDREEFRTLCFNIGVNYDLLKPGGLEAQAIQLVLSCEHAGQIEALMTEIRRVGPGSL